MLTSIEVRGKLNALLENVISDPEGLYHTETRIITWNTAQLPPQKDCT